MKSYKIGLMFLVTLLAGCVWKGKVGPEEPRPQNERQFETIWIDPQIVFSDSLLTLIKATRIDSLPLGQSEYPSRRIAAIEIMIFEPACNVAVSVFNSEHTLVYPLMVRSLTTGFYRLTFAADLLDTPILFPDDYLIRAEYCNHVETAWFAIE